MRVRQSVILGNSIMGRSKTFLMLKFCCTRAFYIFAQIEILIMFVCRKSTLSFLSKYRSLKIVINIKYSRRISDTTIDI